MKIKFSYQMDTSTSHFFVLPDLLKQLLKSIMYNNTLIITACIIKNFIISKVWIACKRMLPEF